MPEVRSPTVRRRELGALLRARRQELRLTVDQVAEHLLCSPSKVSRMETGLRGAALRDVRDLCNLYEITDEEERRRLMTLAQEGKQAGWWQSLGLPYEDFVGLEQEAISMKVYHSTVVPGLLQTGDYARAVHEASLTLTPELSPEVIDQRVEERSTRQQLLDRSNPPRIEIVLDEAVLHRPVGGEAIMREQLRRILEVARRPSVTIQILPFAVGAHPALESNFIILEFAGQPRGIVYVDGLVGWIYKKRTKDVQRYQQIFELLRGIGSSPKDSADLITQIRETYNGERSAASLLLIRTEQSRHGLRTPRWSRAAFDLSHDVTIVRWHRMRTLPRHWGAMDCYCRVILARHAIYGASGPL